MSTSVHLFSWPAFCSRFWPFILGSFRLKQEKCQGILTKHCVIIGFKFIRGTFFCLAGLTDLDVPWQNILFVVSNTTLFLYVR